MKGTIVGYLQILEDLAFQLCSYFFNFYWTLAIVQIYQ